MKTHSILCLAFAVGLFTSVSRAEMKEVPVQARLFGGVTGAKPEDVNQEFEAESLKKVDSLVQYGVEVTYPLARFLNLGLRYTHRDVVRDEEPATSATDYEAEIKQDSALAVVRVPVIKTNIFRLDGFAGFGGTNTTLKLKTATQDGEITRKDGGSWFAAPYSSFGGSVAVGFKNFYFIVEGGVETNKVDNLKRTGTVNANIETIDLSGSFVTVGFMFDGVKATRK